MRRHTVLACLVGALVLAGCADGDEPDAVQAERLPENLCAAVPDSAVTRWQLAEESHATEQGDELGRAECSMSGRVDDVPVTLDISLTSYGAADRDAARARLADELADRCAELERDAAGRFTDDDRRCVTETQARPVPFRGRVTDVSISNSFGGLLTVSMEHGGPTWQLVAAEVVGIAGAIGNADPAELG